MTISFLYGMTVLFHGSYGTGTLDPAGVGRLFGALSEGSAASRLQHRRRLGNAEVNLAPCTSFSRFASATSAAPRQCWSKLRIALGLLEFRSLRSRNIGFGSAMSEHCFALLCIVFGSLMFRQPTVATWFSPQQCSNKFDIALTLHYVSRTFPYGLFHSQKRKTPCVRARVTQKMAFRPLHISEVQSRGRVRADFLT